MTSRSLKGGEGWISFQLVGDAFQLGHWFSYDGKIEDRDQPTVVTTINGEDTKEPDGNLLPLDPGDWYNIGLNASFDPNGLINSDTVPDIAYHPLDNITRIHDIIPESLVGALNDSPLESNEIGCAVPESGSGAISHLRESSGAFLLLPMLFIWYTLRLEF
ncbi:hypothetical protein BDV98DRAFT_558713 [Pterulicium gracile]|uniref:Uncharacterized protein n=1 Tax=Pterulicium gracile TaxID=1884261 RepID=A0A5C3R4V8_9AGAR|nr:hypothetical protein BDV98DRAFT_558713 [Pterula gracilis]